MGDQPHGEGEGSRLIERGLVVALLLSAAVLVVEGVGAFLSRSLALTVDAVHNVPDLLAFAVSYVSVVAIAKGGTDAHTFGSHRLEVFAAILNAFIILAAGVLFAYPAAVGLVRGELTFGSIDPTFLLLAALPTLVLRGAAAFVLGRVPRAARELNVRSVMIHLGTDLVIAAALIGDAVVITFAPTNLRVDSFAALVVSAILVYESVPIFRASWEVLTEGVPRGISLAELTDAIRSTPRVKEVHDVHVWAVCPTFVCMTAHLRIEEMSVTESAALTERIRADVERRFGVVHSVFECEPLEESAPSAAMRRALTEVP